MSLVKQFFSQSNPLNNLNITSSLPPLLQRQNSAPVVQPQQQQQQFNDFYKPNNVNKPSTITSATGQQQPDLQRKYSLPMNSTAVSQQSFALPSQPSQSTNTTSSSYSQPMANIIRKQSAPTITSFPITTSSAVASKVQQPSSSAVTSVQQQFNNNFQQVVHGSPSRARDRNLFDKVPLNQDALIQIQLPLLKGYSKRNKFSLSAPFYLWLFELFIRSISIDAHFFLKDLDY